AIATVEMTAPDSPDAARPPVSASATSCCNSAEGLAVSLMRVSRSMAPCHGPGGLPAVRRSISADEKAGPGPASSLRRGWVLLDPALLLVVARRALVQRRRQAVLRHVLRVQVGQRRVQLLELVEVVEHG